MLNVGQRNTRGVCPKCLLPLIQFKISFEESILMCKMCLFPLDHEDLEVYISSSASKINPQSSLINSPASVRKETFIPSNSVTLPKVSNMDNNSNIYTIKTSTTEEVIEQATVEALKKTLENANTSTTLTEYYDNKFGKTKITIKVLQSLLPRRWLSDCIVHLYYLIIRQKYPNYVYFSPDFTKLLRTGKYESYGIELHIKTSCEQLTNGGIDAILIPMQVSDHWILSVISGDGCVIVYDTLADKKALQQILFLLSNWIHAKFPGIDWEFYHPIKKPQLSEKSNGGVSVCVYGDLFCKIGDPHTDEIVERAGKIDINNYRFVILKKLMDSFDLKFPQTPAPTPPNLFPMPTMNNLDFMQSSLLGDPSYLEELESDLASGSLDEDLQSILGL